jgi:hypothetical protein
MNSGALTDAKSSTPAILHSPKRSSQPFPAEQIQVPNLSMIAALHYIHSAAHPIFVVSAASLMTRI